MSEGMSKEMRKAADHVKESKLLGLRNTVGYREDHVY